jgi:2-polyprenyl-3-methyl-5-hydroxy-6-metoxy-1,4-benzoquinol methylase
MNSIQKLVTRFTKRRSNSSPSKQANTANAPAVGFSTRFTEAVKRTPELPNKIKLPANLKPYQDIWVNGAMIHHGKRTCGRRYKLIYDCLVQRYRPGFTLLDIGASEGYFSIRLSEDLHARATMLEKKSSLSAIVQAQANSRLRAKIGRFDIQTLKSLGNFDVVIALSIVHHFPNWGEMLKHILDMGDTAIIELPTLNKRATKRAESAASMLEMLKWYNPTLIGETSGYAEESRRQLWCIDFATPPSSTSVITGIVTSGRSSSARQAKHYCGGYFENFATQVYPGTLNLRIQPRLHFKNAIIINSAKGPYCLFPCKIEGLSAYIVKPPRAKNRPNSLEIMASVHLREVFGLKDGDSVLVEVDQDHVGNVSDIQYTVKLASAVAVNDVKESDIEATGDDDTNSESPSNEDKPIPGLAPGAW